MGSLTQTDVSHTSPSHFSVSMAFLAFFVTSLERAAIHAWRVDSGGGRRERERDPQDPGRTCSPHPHGSYKTRCIQLARFTPGVLFSVRMLRNHIIIIHNMRSQHKYTAPHLSVAGKKRALCCMFKLAAAPLRTGSLLHDTQYVLDQSQSQFAHGNLHYYITSRV